MSQSKQETVQVPKITITKTAAAALRTALADSEDGNHVHLHVDEDFVTTMDIAQREYSDIDVDTGNLTILVDTVTATRASGLSIDFVDKGGISGFKIDNPNAPAEVIEITPVALQAKLASGEISEFFDVRTEHEREIASIDGALLLASTT